MSPGAKIMAGDRAGARTLSMKDRISDSNLAMHSGQIPWVSSTRGLISKYASSFSQQPSLLRAFLQ